jgi:hypothetical protein
VAEVAADIFGAPPDPALVELAEGAQGNRFFLIELFSGLREDGLVDVDAGKATLVEAVSQGGCVTATTTGPDVAHGPQYRGGRGFHGSPLHHRRARYGP